MLSGIYMGDGDNLARCRAGKRSLVISPNLDKLLEHEERSRRPNATTFPGCDSPMGSTLLAGLPPPPRRNRQSSTAALSRKEKSSTSSSVVGEDSVLSAPDPPPRSSNPYINPAPTAEELFLTMSDDSAPGPSQQSIHIDDRQQSSSRCFSSQTSVRRKFAVPPILRMFANSGTCIPSIPEEGSGFTGFLGFSSAASATTGNKSPDPTQSHLDPNLDNQSSHMSSPATTQPMTTPPPRSVKPPATPNPVLSRHPSRLKKQSPVNRISLNTSKPVTTNFLDEVERADLVRKSRKLARLFGETPNAEAVVNQAGPMPSILANGKDDAQVLPRHGDRHDPDRATAFSRRYSLPPRVDDTPPTDFSTADRNQGFPELFSNRPSSSPQSNSHHQANSIRSLSPISFIELSDDTSVSSSKTASIYLFEDERRRKRERLAKLCRFLGSQVPINLVLGKNDPSAASLPPRQRMDGFDVENRRNTLPRRRSSSAIPSSSTWSDDVERLKADLDGRQKAIIVRRAQKMEKLFGVAPPLTLYASGPSSISATPLLRADDFPSCPSTGVKTSKGLKQSRPATPESSTQLLPKTDSVASFARFDHRSAQTSSASPDRDDHSMFYDHYEHSLNSLNDIVDQDDKASLAELHQVLKGDIVTHGRPTTVPNELDQGDGTTPTRLGHRFSLSSPLPRSERRGSFPSRFSVDSECSFTLPPHSSFQQRRKRAAKLTHFFGVDYRELFDDVLESIENDMQSSQTDGVLRAEEVEDLLQKLRTLKYKRQTLF